MGYIICKDCPFSIQPFCFAESFLQCAKIFIIVWHNPTCLFLLLFPLPGETYPKNIMLIKINIKEHQLSQFIVSCVQLFVTPWIAAHQASLYITNSQSWLKLMSIEAVMPSNHLILCRPLLLPLSIFPSIRVSSNESVLHISWPKYWSFSFSISPSNQYSGLIYFRMDWLDLLAIQGTLRSLLQHHSSKASILQSSSFFIAQLSHPYMTTWKTIALTRQTFIGKVMPLLFNKLSGLVTVFLSRSTCLLISWLQSPSALILEPKKIKSATVSTVSPSICHEVMGPDAMILVSWMLSCKPTFSLSSFTFIKGSLGLLHFLP